MTAQATAVPKEPTMTITRTIRIATATALACAGIGAAVSTPAMAITPIGAMTLSNGPVTPVVVWDHAAWKKCYSLTYAQWREDGHSPSVSQTAADLTCGTQP
jgi:hypothetical protein